MAGYPDLTPSAPPPSDLTPAQGAYPVIAAPIVAQIAQPTTVPIAMPTALPIAMPTVPMAPPVGVPIAQSLGDQKLEPQGLPSLTLKARSVDKTVFYDIYVGSTFVLTTRYSELEKLRSSIQKSVRDFICDFPRKTWGHAKDIDTRVVGLQHYLRSAASHPGVSISPDFTSFFCTYRPSTVAKSVSTGRVDVVVTVSPLNEQRRRFSADDRWHFHKMDVWMFSMSKQGVDSILGQLPPIEGEFTLKIMLKLHDYLQAEGCTIGMSLANDGWFSKPSSDERQKDFMIYFVELLSSESARNNVLLKAFCCNYSMFNVLIKKGKGVTPQQALASLGPDGEKLWKQHCFSMDIGSWAQGQMQAVGLRMHLERLQAMQSSRIQLFRERSLGRQQNESRNQSECALQQNSRNPATTGRQQALADRIAPQAERCRSEQKLLAAQQVEATLQLFPGTATGGTLALPQASRDTGWKFDMANATQSYSSLQTERHAYQSIMSALENIPSQLGQLRGLLAQDEVMLSAALERASCEDDSADPEDQEMCALIALRQQIDSEVWQEKQEYEQEKVAMQAEEATSTAWLNALRPVLSEYTKEEAGWEVEFACLKEEETATSAELALVVNKVQIIYRPLALDSQIADRFEAALQGVLGRSQSRSTSLQDICNLLDNSAAVSKNQEWTSKNRVLGLEKVIALAQQAYSTQQYAHYICPPPMDVPQQWVQSFQASLQWHRNNDAEVKQSGVSARDHVQAAEADIALATQEHATRSAAEDPREFPGQNRFFPPEASPPGALDGVSTEESFRFWKGLIDTAKRAGVRHDSLEVQFRDTVCPAIAHNMKLGEPFRKLHQEAEEALGLWNSALGVEGDMGKQLDQVRDAHTRVRRPLIEKLERDIHATLSTMQGKYGRFLSSAESDLNSLRSKSSSRIRNFKNDVETIDRIMKNSFSRGKPRPNGRELQGKSLSAKIDLWRSWSRRYEESRDAYMRESRSLMQNVSSWQNRGREAERDLKQLSSDMDSVTCTMRSFQDWRRLPLLSGVYSGYNLAFQEDDTDMMQVKVHLVKAQTESLRVQKELMAVHESARNLQWELKKEMHLENSKHRSVSECAASLQIMSGKAEQSHKACSAKIRVIEQTMQKIQREQSERRRIRQQQRQDEEESRADSDNDDGRGHHDDADSDYSSSGEYYDGSKYNDDYNGAMGDAYYEDEETFDSRGQDAYEDGKGKGKGGEDMFDFDDGKGKGKGKGKGGDTFDFEDGKGKGKGKGKDMFDFEDRKGDRKGRCYHCEGKGFSHDSPMDHDKPWDEKCFFCKECGTCGGRGDLS